MGTRAVGVQWWCAPELDDQPLCWRLLDPSGGTARFPHLQYVDADGAPAGVSATALLRDAVGVIEVRDGLLLRTNGVALVRLLRRGGSSVDGPVEHELHLGGFDAPPLTWWLTGAVAADAVESASESRAVRVCGGEQDVRDTTLISRLHVTDRAWSALVIGIDAEPEGDADDLLVELAQRDAEERRRLEACRLPQSHPERALDTLAVIRACTARATGAVVASPTTSLPEAPGHDRQFDYRYTWLRDASLSTAVAALLGQGDDARRYLTRLADADAVDAAADQVEAELGPIYLW